MLVEALGRCCDYLNHYINGEHEAVVHVIGCPRYPRAVFFLRDQRGQTLSPPSYRSCRRTAILAILSMSPFFLSCLSSSLRTLWCKSGVESALMSAVCIWLGQEPNETKELASCLAGMTSWGVVCRYCTNCRSAWFPVSSAGPTQASFSTCTSE